MSNEDAHFSLNIFDSFIIRPCSLLLRISLSSNETWFGSSATKLLHKTQRLLIMKDYLQFYALFKHSENLYYLTALID